MAQTIPIATRFCRLELPAGWTPAPQVGGFLDRGAARWSAAVSENWVDPPTTPAAFAETQLEWLDRETPDVELVEAREGMAGEMPVHDAVYRSPSPAGDLLHHQRTSVFGPLVVTLTLTGDAASRDHWTPVFSQIRHSFQVSSSATFTRIVRRELDTSWVGDAGSTSRVGMPSVGLGLPVPAGWTADVDDCRLLGPRGATVAACRLDGTAGALDQHFASVLVKSLRSAPDGPTSWARGETGAGHPMYLLEKQARQRRQWVAEEVRVKRTAIIDLDGLVELVLDADEQDSEAFAAFDATVHELELMTPELRLLRLGEPFLEVELEGPWRALSPGLYVRTQAPPAALQVTGAPRDAGIEGLRTAWVDALRRDEPSIAVDLHTDAGTRWRGDHAARLHATLSAENAPSEHVHGLWLEDRDTIWQAVIQSVDSQLADDLAFRLLQGYRSVEPEERS